MDTMTPKMRKPIYVSDGTNEFVQLLFYSLCNGIFPGTWGNVPPPQNCVLLCLETVSIVTKYYINLLHGTPKIMPFVMSSNDQYKTS